jgi:hypothetical protein
MVFIFATKTQGFTFTRFSFRVSGMAYEAGDLIGMVVLKGNDWVNYQIGLTVKSQVIVLVF